MVEERQTGSEITEGASGEKALSRRIFFIAAAADKDSDAQNDQQ
jgi:hypothetical protein